MRFSREFLIAIIGLIIGVLAAIVAFQQLQLQQLQIELQKQQLEYSVFQSASSSEKSAISETEKVLVERFFHDLNAYVQAHPGASYADSVKAVLPMTGTLPATQFATEVLIRNNGKATATRVRAIFTMDRPVGSFAVDSLEPYSVVKGGKGNSQIAIEVDRIVAGSVATVTVTSERPQIQGQQDNMSLRDLSETFGKFRGPSLISDLSKKDSNGYQSNFFPVLFYVRAGNPKVTVLVTSNEGAGISVPRVLTPVQ